MQQIVARRANAGKTEYFIKWVGYGSGENTWEPESKLKCIAKVVEFERRYISENVLVCKRCKEMFQKYELSEENELLKSQLLER